MICTLKDVFVKSPPYDIIAVHACFLADLNDKFITSLSSKISTDYLKFGVNLGRKIKQIHGLEKKYHMDPEEILTDILDTWSSASKQSEAEMLETLVAALEDIGRNDVVTFVNDGESFNNIPQSIVA